MFDPVIQRLREMGTPGLIMSGSKDEGRLLGGVTPSSQPPGRGYLADRRASPRLVQAALTGHEQAVTPYHAEDEEPAPGARAPLPAEPRTPPPSSLTWHDLAQHRQEPYSRSPGRHAANGYRAEGRQPRRRHP